MVPHSTKTDILLDNYTYGTSFSEFLDHLYGYIILDEIYNINNDGNFINEILGYIQL